MGYVLRVRLASFFAGAAAASALGLFVLHRDYKVAQESMSRQVEDFYESLDTRISHLENLKKIEPSTQSETTAQGEATME